MLRGTIPILQVGHNLLATIQSDLHDMAAEEFQQDLLTSIEKRGAHGVVVDITGLETVDSYVARVLADTARMAKLVGAEMVLCGMRPEIAATLVRMGYAMNVRTALNVDAGLALLGRTERPQRDPRPIAR